VWIIAANLVNTPPLTPIEPNLIGLCDRIAATPVETLEINQILIPISNPDAILTSETKFRTRPKRIVATLTQHKRNAPYILIRLCPFGIP
jgi:hypothetical protein